MPIDPFVSSSLGKIAYEAWCRSMALKYPDRWENLAVSVKSAWANAAEKIYQLKIEQIIQKVVDDD